MDVTLEAVQAHLSLATPRQGHARARARTTPAWRSLSSIITRTAPPLLQKEVVLVRVTAGYAHMCPTGAKALALVRR